MYVMSQKNCEVWKVSVDGNPTELLWTGFTPEEAWAQWKAFPAWKDRIAVTVSDWPNLGHPDATRTEKFSLGVSKFKVVLAQERLRGEKKAFEKANSRLREFQDREMIVWQNYFNEVEKVESQVKLRGNEETSLRHELALLEPTLFGTEVYRCMLCDRTSLSLELRKDARCYVAKDSIRSFQNYSLLITQLNKLEILRPFRWTVEEGFFTLQGQTLPSRKDIRTSIRQHWGIPYATERKATDLYFELNFDTAILLQFDQHEVNYLQVSLIEYR